jgi:transposase
MIDPEKRKAIFLLHQEGMSVREIARRLHVSRQTVVVIIAQKGQMPQPVRATKNEIDIDLLRRLYVECEGWVQRMHEKLAEEHHIKVKYSTLTRMLRNLGISTSPETRCSRVPDEPGAEMQHDTTVYQVKLGDQTVRLVATILYLRYSKRRYLKFYRTFNRFQMKCFLNLISSAAIDTTGRDELARAPKAPTKVPPRMVRLGDCGHRVGIGAGVQTGKRGSRMNCQCKQCGGHNR